MGTKFITEDFLLTTRTARRLYHEYAEAEPICDFHCHLPPGDIARNRQFSNLFEIWLEGDHYKWRAMRSNGVPERFCTGDATPFEKFMAWAKTVPYTLRNPLYHWTHLELKRYFGIDELLDESSAERIWKRANAKLATPELTTQGILKKFNVKVICTTDDPTDSLDAHIAFAAQVHPTRMLPTFRPDKALTVNLPDVFNKWVSRLEAAANVEIRNFDAFLEALDKRHEFFHNQGCRLSDHGLNHCYADFCNEKEAARIFERARRGQQVSPAEHSQFASFMMEFFGRLNAKRGWVMQLHLGAMRNNNTRMMQRLGPDTGFDSIGDWPQAAALAAFLDRLDQQNALPKTIIYNINPADNYVFGTMLGNFQDGSVPGKIQLGSGWWFLDQKEGMEWQLNALSNLGLLSRFVGMVTDSRSFMSFPRHEYFRRVLCNLIGRDVEDGLLPDDEKLLGSMIRNICYNNAQTYLGLNALPSAPVQEDPVRYRRLRKRESKPVCAQ
ncbi:MAG: glucuronate isomerase [Verrucomicrobiae bacterium]|nr:glucuronate isomerase [Verrucomicrobiae bacterium]